MPELGNKEGLSRMDPDADEFFPILEGKDAPSHRTNHSKACDNVENAWIAITKCMQALIEAQNHTIGMLTGWYDLYVNEKNGLPRNRVVISIEKALRTDNLDNDKTC